MSFSSEEAAILANSLGERMRLRSLSAANIAKDTGVDASRISRILKGKFKTLNPTLVQICNYLGVSTTLGQERAAAARIAASALGIWDGSSEDAEEVVKLLEQIAAMRNRNRA